MKLRRGKMRDDGRLCLLAAIPTPDRAFRPCLWPQQPRLLPHWTAIPQHNGACFSLVRPPSTATAYAKAAMCAQRPLLSCFWGILRVSCSCFFDGVTSTLHESLPICQSADWTSCRLPIYMQALRRRTSTRRSWGSWEQSAQLRSWVTCTWPGYAAIGYGVEEDGVLIAAITVTGSVDIMMNCLPMATASLVRHNWCGLGLKEGSVRNGSSPTPPNVTTTASDVFQHWAEGKSVSSQGYTRYRHHQSPHEAAR